MTFSFDDTIPAANNNPSNDQPKMLLNNKSTKSIIAVDHVTFNAIPAGTHKQVTISSKNTPGLQTDPQSVIFTQNGVASPFADAFFKNQNLTFPLSNIRAWAFCSGTVASPGNSVIANQSVNVTSVIKNSAGNYTVTLVAGAVSAPSTDFAILVTSSLSTPTGRTLMWGYTITGIGTFTLKFTNTAIIDQDPLTFSFQVLQV